MKSLTRFALGLCIAAGGLLTGSSAVQAQTSLTGAGATFPYPIYSKWFDEYRKANPGVEINYQSIGSGGGIRQVTEGTVDFGATDGPMKDEQINEFKTKRGSDILHFPTVLGAVVPTYNVAGVATSLKFSPEVLAGIYLGTITKWNDPSIAKDNAGTKLPDTNIVVVHRSDGSGTTYIWADYLAKVSPAWKEKVGVNTSVDWPVGLGGKGNEGVAGLVKQTEGAIGYVELIFAVQNKLDYGAVKNAAGNFIKADLGSVTEAAAAAAKSMPDDFRVSITNAPGANAYPISSFTWLLVPKKIADPTKKQVLVGFLKWMQDKGQSMTESLEYARLPNEVIKLEEKAIDKIE